MHGARIDGAKRAVWAMCNLVCSTGRVLTVMGAPSLARRMRR
jgi:hypothetical protein